MATEKTEQTEMDKYRAIAAALVAKLNSEHPELKAREERAMRRYATKLVSKEG